MSLGDADIAFATDLFSDIPALTTRKMFGGIYLYSQGIVFALMSSDAQLFLKTQAPDALFGQPSEQFHNMPYWALPEDILDDPAKASRLAAQALDALV